MLVQFCQMKEFISPIGFDGDEREYSINSSERWLSIDEYMQKKFWGGSDTSVWDMKKFDAKLPAASLLDVMLRAAGSLEDNFKQTATEYNEAKVKRAAVSFKDTGSHTTNDLLDVITPACVEDAGGVTPAATDDFIFTHSLATVLVCVPKGGEKEFESWYEGDIEKEKVIPQSHKRINVKADKDGVTLYRVVIYNAEGKELDNFKKSCRDNKYIVRDYPYSKDWFAASVAEREQANANFVLEHIRLLEVALSSYSDLFGIWVHLKLLRAGIECTLRNGISEGPRSNFEAFFVVPEASKLAKARADLAQILGTDADRRMDSGADEEEFFPYVSLTLAPLTTSK